MSKMTQKLCGTSVIKLRVSVRPKNRAKVFMTSHSWVLENAPVCQALVFIIALYNNKIKNILSITHEFQVV